MGSLTVNHFFKKSLGILFLGEIFLCGSGQILQLPGGLTLKMFNYGLMLLLAITGLIYRPWADKSVLQFIGFFIGCLLLGALMSILNNGYLNLFTDLSPLLYFFTFLYFDSYIKNVSDIVFIIKVLKFSVLSLACVYLLYMLLISTGVLNFDVVYLLLQNHTDIMFRGNDGTFFYKGFLYFAITIIFYISEGKLISWQSALLLAAIYFTRTRGFLVIVMCACIFYFCYWLYARRYLLPVKYIIWSIFIFIVFLFFAADWYESFVGVERQGGDLVRLQTIREVIEQITPLSFFIGHGFGVGVPIRPVHMEMAYLEIFHKQGIIGLLFWGWLFIRSFLFFYKSTLEHQLQSLPFILSIVIIYIQSFFNPFLNNPIGMSFVLISYISIKRIGNQVI